MLTRYFVQIRRGGFINPSPWGDKGNPFLTLEGARGHIRGMKEWADKQNIVIDYILSDEAGNVIEQG